VSTTTIALVVAAVGILAVLGLSWVFYLVGRGEDRERAAAAAERARRAQPPAESAPRTHGPGEHRSPGLARDRRRPMPPRRPH
jgi:hypothetical protein